MKNYNVLGILGGIVIFILYSTDTIGGLGALGLILLLMFAGGILVIKEKKKKINADIEHHEIQLSQLENFSPTKKFVDTCGLIAIDDNSKQIAIKDKNSSIIKFSYWIIYF